MTNPAGMPSNEDIVASVHDLELEGDEQAQVAQQVSDFIAAEKATFNTEIANLQSKVDALSASAMDDTTRQSVNDSLKALKSTFDSAQRVLVAAITPPDQPVPEPTPDNPPLGGSSASSRRR